MTGQNGQDLPFLVAGGGIGGLVTAYALASKGFPVRVFEQAPEFKELGAGIQLGPNIFRALERIGLKASMLEDAWVPDKLEMRDALTAEEITSVPLGEPFIERFKQPYAVTHRADIHGVYLRACQGSNLVSLENSRRVDDFADHGDSVTLRLDNGEEVGGRALIGCDGMWSKVRAKVVGDGAPRVSGHIAYRAVLKREDVPDDLWRPDMVLWAGPKTHFVVLSCCAAARSTTSSRPFYLDRYVEGWNAEGAKDELFARFAGQRPEVLRLLERIETWRMWVLCDREPVKDWTKGRVTLLGDAAHPMLQYLAQGACMATEDAVCLAEKMAATPGRRAGRLPCLLQQQRYLRTGRVQIMARVYGELYHARGVRGRVAARHWRLARALGATIL